MCALARFGLRASGAPALVLAELERRLGPEAAGALKEERFEDFPGPSGPGNERGDPEFQLRTAPDHHATTKE